MTIPVVDLADFINGDSKQKSAFVQELGKAYEDGLQILTKKNEWIGVTSLPDQIVVNVGDMLQRLTNNKLKSTTHRVINPPRELWHTSRFSIPFFLHPKSAMSLIALDSCVDEKHPKVYDDITAGDYLDERLREIGLKK